MHARSCNSDMNVHHQTAVFVSPNHGQYHTMLTLLNNCLCIINSILYITRTLFRFYVLFMFISIHGFCGTTMISLSCSKYCGLANEINRAVMGIAGPLHNWTQQRASPKSSLGRQIRLYKLHPTINMLTLGRGCYLITDNYIIRQLCL